MAVIIDDDEREDKDDTEESMDHPTTGNRQLEELAHHLEETKIEMQRKGDTFVLTDSYRGGDIFEVNLSSKRTSREKYFILSEDLKKSSLARITEES